MSRSNHSGGCFRVAFTLLIGVLLGMLFLAIGIGILKITLTKKDGGMDIGFDIISDPATEQLE